MRDFITQGRSNIILLEGSQAFPAHPYVNDRGACVNNIYKYSPYLKENIMNLHYKAKSCNAV